MATAWRQGRTSSHPRQSPEHETYENRRLEQFIKNDFSGQKFIAYIDNGVKMQLSDCMKPNENILILIGPEGGFSKEEVKLATSLGYIPISLGKSRYDYASICRRRVSEAIS